MVPVCSGSMQDLHYVSFITSLKNHESFVFSMCLLCWVDERPDCRVPLYRLVRPWNQIVHWHSTREKSCKKIIIIILAITNMLGFCHSTDIKKAPLPSSDFTSFECHCYGSIANFLGCFGTFILGSNDICDNGTFLRRDYTLGILHRPSAASNCWKISTYGKNPHVYSIYNLLSNKSHFRPSTWWTWYHSLQKWPIKEACSDAFEIGTLRIKDKHERRYGSF